MTSIDYELFVFGAGIVASVVVVVRIAVRGKVGAGILMGAVAWGLIWSLVMGVMPATDPRTGASDLDTLLVLAYGVVGFVAGGIFGAIAAMIGSLFRRG